MRKGTYIHDVGCDKGLEKESYKKFIGLGGVINVCPSNNPYGRLMQLKLNSFNFIKYKNFSPSKISIN